MRWIGRVLACALFFAVPIGLILASSGHFQMLPFWVLTLTCSAVAAHFLPNFSFLSRGRKWHLVTLGIVGLAFRILPFRYEAGGQDPGAYVLLSAIFEHTGGFEIQDPIVPLLNKSEVAHYWKYGGNAYAGVSAIDPQNGTFTTDLYPLISMWFAVFSKTFSSHLRTHALTLFSLGSIFAYYFVATHILSGSLAFWAALLLAINPLHVFFSRFPSSELISLFYLLSTILFFAEYYREKSTGYLWLSALAATGFFSSRMNYIFYMPLVFLMTVSAAASLQDKQGRRAFYIYLLGLLTLAVSVGFFYALVQPRLFTDIVSTLWNPLGANGPSKLIALTLLFLVVWIAALKFNALKALLTRLTEGRTLLLIRVTVGLIILGFSCYNFWKLGFSGQFKGDSFDTFWHIAEKGWGSLRHIGLYTAAAYLGPVFFIATLAAIFINTKKRSEALIILSFLYFLLFYVAFNKFTQYHYYFARYYLAEVIPLGILVALIFLSRLKSTTLQRTAIGLSAVFFFIHSMPHLLGLQEGPTRKSLDQVMNELPEGTLVLSRTDIPYRNEFNAPIVFVHQRDLIRFEQLPEIGNLKNLIGKHESVVIVGNKPMPALAKQFHQSIVDYEFHYFSNCKSHLYDGFSHGLNSRGEPAPHTDYPPKCSHIPTRHYRGYMPLYFYQIPKSDYGRLYSTINLIN